MRHFSAGILYAVGGYDGATRQCLSTVEAYNPKSNTWSYIAEMGTRRSGAGACWATLCTFTTQYCVHRGRAIVFLPCGLASAAITTFYHMRAHMDLFHMLI